MQQVNLARPVTLPNHAFTPLTPTRVATVFEPHFVWCQFPCAWPHCAGLPLDPSADPLNPSTPYRFWLRGAVDPSLQLLVPSSTLYVLQERARSAGAGGSSSLSTGAIVGIAVGATAGAVAAAGLLWWGLGARRRQRRRSQGLAMQLKAAAEEGAPPCGSGSSESGVAGSGSSDGNGGRPILDEPANQPLPSNSNEALPGPQLSPTHGSHYTGGSGDLTPLPELVQVT